jgi:hypothetical protein
MRNLGLVLKKSTPISVSVEFIPADKIDGLIVYEFVNLFQIRTAIGIKTDKKLVNVAVMPTHELEQVYIKIYQCLNARHLHSVES